jgi:hypothetical protein
MAFRLNKNDRKLLISIAEHQVLSVSQVTAIQQKSRQVVRRRLKILEEARFIASTSRGFGQGLGRPERLISLGQEGFNLLRPQIETLEDSPESRLNPERIPYLEHHLLINWFRIHLQQIEHIVPELSVRFIAPTSPFMRRHNMDRLIISEPNPPTGRTGESTGFTPDGVFSITHKAQEKTLLFFLEVDRGTEAIASPKRDPRDIRQKIINYQEYFRSAQYKRYEKLWDCKLNGFRLLFLSNTNSRLVALCRLVQEMPPSNFVWLTSAEYMFSDGLSAEIWFHGGKQDNPPKSILGPKMACKAPIPPLKP